MPTLKVACTGAELMNIGDMTEFQGELKSLSEHDYKKLRTQLEESGYSFPISIWKAKDGLNYILDGHQRLRTIKKMAVEGWKIPNLPVSITEASNYKEAKKKLLAGASHYGKIQDQGLYEYAIEANLTYEEIADIISTPEIDLNKFHAEFYQDINDTIEAAPIEGSKELTSDMFDNFDHQCPKCGFEFNGKK